MPEKQGKVFVLSAPAGTGKTTLVKRLTEEFSNVVQSISYTSRKRRPNEVDGVDYHFVSKEEFERKLSQGEFLEHAQVYEDYYGTNKEWVEKRLREGKHVFLVIDTQGAKQIKKLIPAVFIFVFPPSLEELRHRLEHRQTERLEVIKERLSWSAKEIEAGKNYQYHIVNDELEKAYTDLRKIVMTEDHSEENIYGV
ncbi:MAG: Guanylate kinase [Chlamydiae bacterium]|nr:Guanylate kinase [Chlamydiota bacterium]